MSKKDVYMISTFHDTSMKKADRQDACKMKPIVCCNYNDTMGGVDLSNCFFSLYPSAQKCQKNLTKSNLGIFSYNFFLIIKLTFLHN